MLRDTKGLEDVRQRLKTQAKRNLKNLIVQSKRDQELIYQLVAINQVLMYKRNRLANKIKVLKNKIKARNRTELGKPDNKCCCPQKIISCF